jgi:hypothetical protein
VPIHLCRALAGRDASAIFGILLSGPSNPLSGEGHDAGPRLGIAGPNRLLNWHGFPPAGTHRDDARLDDAALDEHSKKEK